MMKKSLLIHIKKYLAAITDIKAPVTPSTRAPKDETNSTNDSSTPEHLKKCKKLFNHENAEYLDNEQLCLIGDTALSQPSDLSWVIPPINPDILPSVGEQIAAVGTGGSGMGGSSGSSNIFHNYEIAAVGTGGTGSGDAKTVGKVLLASLGSIGLYSLADDHSSTSTHLVNSNNTGNPPSNILTTINDNEGNTTGLLIPSGTTDDNTPTLSGYVGTQVTNVFVYDNDTLIGSNTVSADGTWTFTPTTALSDGAHAFYVVTTDSAGNLGAHSDTWYLTIRAPVLESITPSSAMSSNAPFETSTLYIAAESTHIDAGICFDEPDSLQLIQKTLSTIPDAVHQSLYFTTESLHIDTVLGLSPLLIANDFSVL